MPRGGRRAGKPGKAYPNRSDMQTQPVTTAPNQTYGQAGEQAKAQKVAPLAGPAPSAPQGGGAPRPMPPQMAAPPQPLDAPTQRPNEPLMHGAPVGPGSGPEVLPQAPEQIDQMGLFLRELYRAQPSEDVHQLVVRHELSARPAQRPSSVPPAQGVPGGPQPGGPMPPQMGPMGGPPMRPVAQGVEPGPPPMPGQEPPMGQPGG